MNKWLPRKLLAKVTKVAKVAKVARVSFHPSLHRRFHPRTSYDITTIFL